MTLYEVNKQAYLQLPKMTEAEIEKAKEYIIKEFLTYDGEFYMLVCNEHRYYTLFQQWHNTPNWKEKLTEEVIEVAKELGTLKAIEVSNSMVEFWIEQNGDVFLYPFFNYDRGVIKV